MRTISPKILVVLVVLTGLSFGATLAWAVGHDEVCCSGPGSFHFELKDWESPNDGADFNPGETITFRQKYHLEITGDLAAYVPKKNMRRTRYFRLIKGSTIYPLYSGVATLSDTSRTFVSEKSVQIPLDIPLGGYKAAILRDYNTCANNSQPDCPSNNWSQHIGSFAWWVNVDIVEDPPDCPSAVCGGYNGGQAQFSDWRFYDLCVNGCPGGDGYPLGDCWYDRTEKCDHGCSNGTCEGAPSPVCPNGSCESGENATNCPADCGTPGPVCPNGTCESGENSSNCPADCPPAPQPPAKPDGLQVTSNGCEGDKPKVSFKWNSSSGADYYTIDTADNNLICPVAWKDVNGTSFTWSAASPIYEMPLGEVCGGTQDTTPQNNKNYWWRVNALNSAGHTSSEVKEFTTKQCVTEAKGDFWTSIPRDPHVNIPAPFPYAIALTEGHGKISNTTGWGMCSPNCIGVLQLSSLAHADVKRLYEADAIAMLGSWPSFVVSANNDTALYNPPTNVTIGSLYFRGLTTDWYGDPKWGGQFVPVEVNRGSSWSKDEVKAIAACYNAGIGGSLCMSSTGLYLGSTSTGTHWYYSDATWAFYNKRCVDVWGTCPEGYAR